MSTNVPDCWVVVEITNEDEKFKKVLTGWYGGYAGSDSWKLSSAIESVEEFEDRFEFHNLSGSLYVCYKNAQRMSGYVSSIYNSWVLKSEQNDDLKIEIIKY